MRLNNKSISFIMQPAAGDSNMDTNLIHNI